MGLLDGQVALVTGGARGMGKSHAVAFAREGADVVLLDAAPILGMLHVQPTAILTPEEITAAVMFLVGVGGAHITGSVIDVNAGASARITA
jgi:hypothetical protein